MPRKPRAAEPERYPGTYPTGPATWCYKLRLPTDPASGKRHWEVRGGFTTARAAWSARERRRMELEERKAPLTKQTVRELVDGYLDAISLSVDASSLRAYRGRAERHIYPHIGNVLVRDVDIDVIGRWVVKLSRTGTTRAGVPCGLSPRTIATTRGVLSAAFNYAIDNRRLSWNPVPRAVRLRMTAPTKPKTWTNAEIATFLSTIAGTDDEAYWYLALLSQLRPGELAALTWADVDLERAVIRVRRTRTIDAAGRWIVGEDAKTPASVRDVTIPPQCVALLRRHIDRQQFQRRAYGDLWQDNGYVFPGRRGVLLPPSTMTRRLDRLCAAANITRLTQHGLRHTGATMARRLGINAETVSRRLGHVSVGFTLDHYSETNQDDQRQAADELERGIQRLEKPGM